jgi:hypothetical protein
MLGDKICQVRRALVKWSIRTRKVLDWYHLRWLLLLPTLALSALVGAITLFFSVPLAQFPYFALLDAIHRHASRNVAGWAVLSIGGLGDVVVMSLPLVGVLAAISPGFRRRSRSIFTVSAIGVLACCALIAAAVLIASEPDRRIPLTTPTWRVSLDRDLTAQNTYFAATRHLAVPDPFHVVLAAGGTLTSLDAHSGATIGTKSVSGYDPLVFVSSSGKILVSNGDELQLLSPDLQPLNISFPLPGSGAADHISPSGARVSWQRFQKELPRTFLLDADSLKIVGEFGDCNVEAISDDSVAQSVVLVKEESTPAIEVCGPKGTDRVLYRGPHQSHYFFYLNNETMLLINGTGITLLDDQGVVRGTDSWPEDVNFAGVSRDGSRFAIATARWGFGDPAYINRETIIVYDTATLRPIAQVRSEPTPEMQSWSALSQDGRALALASGKSLSYFRIQ